MPLHFLFKILFSPTGRSEHGRPCGFGGHEHLRVAEEERRRAEQRGLQHGAGCGGCLGVGQKKQRTKQTNDLLLDDGLVSFDCMVIFVIPKERGIICVCFNLLTSGDKTKLTPTPVEFIHIL